MLAEAPHQEFLYNWLDVKEILASVIGVEISQIKTLKEDETPPLNDSGCSIIYILKNANNFYYVGETDNFLHRVMARRINSKCEFFYAEIKNGKSAARLFEQKLITKLKNSGFPMISIFDAKNLNFGVGL